MMCAIAALIHPIIRAEIRKCKIHIGAKKKTRRKALGTIVPQAISPKRFFSDGKFKLVGESGNLKKKPKTSAKPHCCSYKKLLFHFFHFENQIVVVFWFVLRKSENRRIVFCFGEL